jgi:hypothetical protein
MINIPLQLGVKTSFKLVSVNPETGRELELTGWSPNIMLTTGRNKLSTQDNWDSAVQVGTDATTPAAGQTALLAYVAGTNQVEETDTGNASSAPYYGWKTRRFRFLPGSVSGNLAEVGLGWGTTDTGDNLGFRALLVDINGDQTTVTPLIDEYLDVIVEIRLYPPLDDVTGTVVFDGVTYNYILRASLVTGIYWSANIGREIGEHSPFNTTWSAYDGDIGATIDLGPSGIAYPADSADGGYNLAYLNNSYEQRFGFLCGVGGWNATTGKLMRSLQVVSRAGAFQIQFDSQSNPGNGIPKTDSYTMGVQFTIAWSDAGPRFSGSVPAQNWFTGLPVSLDIASYFTAEAPLPWEFTLIAGSLPTGVTLNATTGLISGTPTVVSSGNAQVKMENDVGFDITNLFAWDVA